VTMPVTRKFVRLTLAKTVATAAAGAVLLVGCGHTTPTAAPSHTAATGTQPSAVVPPPIIRLSPQPPTTAPAPPSAAPTPQTAAAPPGATPPGAPTPPSAPAPATTPTRPSSAAPAPATTPTRPSSAAPAAATAGPPSPDKRTPAPSTEPVDPAGGVVTDPQYPVDNINRTVLQQVAWAYLVQRLSYSWHDPHAGDGIRRAARYTTAAKTAALLADLRNNSAGTWATAQTHQVQASVTVRRMQWAAAPAASNTSGPVAVVVYFTRTFGEAGTIPTTNAGNTTLTLTPQPGGTWAVAADNFGTPN